MTHFYEAIQKLAAMPAHNEHSTDESDGISFGTLIANSFDCAIALICRAAVADGLEPGVIVQLLMNHTLEVQEPFPGGPAPDDAGDRIWAAAKRVYDLHLEGKVMRELGDIKHGRAGAKAVN